MVKTMILMGRSKKVQYSYSIVPTMFDKRTRASTAALLQLNQDYHDNLWDDVIPVDTKFRDASLSHLPASHYAPRSRGVKAYERLLDYLLAKDFSHVKNG
jgi:chromosome partitioning protein